MSASLLPFSSHSAVARSANPARDERLDFIRGLALVMIFIDHMSGNGLAALTLRAFGFADAAEVFVFIAGMSAVYAYRKRFAQNIAGGTAAVFARVCKLYLAHLATAAVAIGFAILVILSGSSFDMSSKLGLAPLVEDPVAAGIRLLMLGYLPHHLDILPLYVLLLSALPLVLIGQRVHWSLPLAGAMVIYLLARAYALNLPNLGGDGWYLNPLAWLLLFTLGATAARLTLDRAWDGLSRSLMLAITILAAFYVVFALLVAAPWQNFGPFAGFESLLAVSVSPDKMFLSWHRLLDLLAKAWLVAVLMPRAAGFMQTGVGGILSRMGRHSLPVFSLGIFASLAGSVALYELGGDLGSQIVLTLAGFLLMAGLAWRLDGGRLRARALLRRLRLA
ncbi:MAG: OpgC family protein [Beijerinckiaceae bacterium]